MSYEDSKVNINFANAWPLPGVWPSKRDSKKLQILSRYEGNEKFNSGNLNGIVRSSVGNPAVKTSYNMIPNSFPKKEKDEMLSLETKTAHVNSSAGGSVVMNLEEKKRLRSERQKIKKEARKQEKAMQREEEIRKKRLAPKDQKVTIIDSSVLERFQMKTTQSAQAAIITPICSSSEFPSLREIMSSGKSQSSRSQRRSEMNIEISQDETVTNQEQDSSITTDSETSFDQKEGEKSAEVVLQDKERNCGENKNFEETPKTEKSGEETSSGKKPKRKDLIQVDIHEILKAKESKADSQVKQQKQTHKNEDVRFCGNTLDSDNPQMNRGKHREIPKQKKPSPLKQVLLQERAKRKESNLKNSFKKCVQSSEINVPNNEEISNCIENTVYGDLEGKNCDSKHSRQNETVPNILTSDSDPSNSGKEKSGGCNFGKVSDNADQNKCVKEESKSTSEESKIDEDIVCSSETNDNNCSSEIIADRSPKPKIHSRKFRDYCDNCILPEILSLTTALLEDIIRFHDRQFARSPLKASAKRRHITGLKEVRRFLALRKIRLLVIAPDLEPSGSLDEIIGQLKESAIFNGVPYVFALERRQLGRILKKNVPVSCVGILNYDGTEHNFHNLMSALEKGRELYKVRAGQLPLIQNVTSVEESQKYIKESVVGDINKEVVASLLAKLTETKEKNDSSRLLQAIERYAETDSDNGNEE